MNSIDAETRKQETRGPQPPVTGGNLPSLSLTHTSHILLWEDDTQKPDSCALRTRRYVVLETLLPTGLEQGVVCGCHSLCLATAAKKENLNPEPRGGKAVTGQEGISMTFYSQPFFIQMHGRDICGRQGNGESAPKTVASCCQHQAVRMLASQKHGIGL